jgi:hypothetical protein
MHASYATSIAETLLTTPIGLPSFVFNRRGDTFHVVDGKQRVASIISIASGIVPCSVSVPPVFLTPHSSAWHFTNLRLKGDSTLTETIDALCACAGVDPDAIDGEALERRAVVPEEAQNKFFGIQLLIQQFEEWPSSALAAAAALYAVKTLSHSPDEILYQLECPLIQLLRKHEASLVSAVSKIARGTDNSTKGVFGNALRGFCCAIPNVSFVPKASNLVGFGTLLDQLVSSSEDRAEENETDVAKTIRRACTTRLDKFCEYVTTNDKTFSFLKPDAQALLFFMLYHNFEVSGMYALVHRLVKPGKKGGDFDEISWYQNTFRKDANIRDSFQTYLRSAIESVEV